ncbi:hypothetical protein ACQEVF_16665 [Nonomuraea polychroma]|uniref:hypothetical protein n=1 Tax=Nonomuraea polychroma TaxID=46176 RepID=UPI003D8DDB57
MGLARLALAALAVGVVVTLLFIGGRALLASLSTPTQAERERERATALPTATGTATEEVTVPTLHIECLAETCPTVTVRVPGGDVLQHREMSKGEEVSFFEPELDVVLSDSGTVRVTENGKQREQGELGAKKAFTARAPG